MLRTGNQGHQLSLYSTLYDKIPEDHILKRIHRAVDFSFINDLLKDSYCKDFGRPAKEPEMMMKLNLLEYLYGYSDVKVIEESTYNLAYLWFLGLNPEDKLPDPSLLAKFRTQRMKDVTLDEVMSEIVRQCVEKGLIQGKMLTVDATHIEANCKKQVPERVMKHLAKRIFKGLEADNGEIPPEIDTRIPDYKQIEDHEQSKQAMKDYLVSVMEAAEQHAGEETAAAIEESRDVLADEKFMLQKGLRSLADQDARVGSKSKTDRFFGYKAEFTMTADERIITAMDVHSGEYVDGKDFEPLLSRTLETGVQVEACSGDKAYFREDILTELDRRNIEDYIPVSGSAYKIDEDLFSYNKDSDQWFCVMGNRTVSCKPTSRVKNGKEHKYLIYVFSKQQCVNCPHREQCMGKSRGKARKLWVSTSASLFYEKSQRQKSTEFQVQYRRRAAHEWKNGEMKRFHGMARAKGWGLRSVLFQAKFTAIAVNLKRIAALVEQLFFAFPCFSAKTGTFVPAMCFRGCVSAL